MNLLAFDTSTERLSAAVQRGAARWRYEGTGGPQASAVLIPALFDLLARAGLALADLDALVFGRGPGSFTGLRTACSVAQGLAFGAALPVLPVDTLLAVAEDVRRRNAQRGGRRVLAMLDARMSEVYAAACVWDGGVWQAAGPTMVCAPQALALPAGANPAQWILAGNVFHVSVDTVDRLPLRALPCVEAWPTADALLSLAPAQLAQGLAVAAQDALPIYVRDKVAQTVAERTVAGAVR